MTLKFTLKQISYEKPYYSLTLYLKCYTGTLRIQNLIKKGKLNNKGSKLKLKEQLVKRFFVLV